MSRWGLTPDADLVYRTLVTFGPATAGGLASALGLSRRRVDDALDALGHAGAAGEQAAARGQPVWTARDAAVVTAALDRFRPANSGRRSPALVDGHGIGGGVYHLASGLRHLSTRAVTRQRLAALVSMAREEHLTINPEPSFDAASTAAAAPLEESLASRGVAVRVLGVQIPEPSAFAAPASMRFAYRQAAALPMKLIVIDRKVAIFPVEPLDYERGYLEVTQPAVIEALVASFETYWSTSSDPRENIMPDLSLTPRERALIGLLVAGHTDAMAARELHISERSVTSIMRSLMDRVGVSNRFQLGVALGTLRVAPVPPGLAGRPSTVDTPATDPALESIPGETS